MLAHLVNNYDYVQVFANSIVPPLILVTAKNT